MKEGPIGYKLSRGKGELLTGLWPDLRPYSWPLRSGSGSRSALRHSDLACRCLSAIPAWQRGLLDGLRHGDPTHRYLSGILAWRRSHLSALRHGVPAPRHLRGWFCAMNTDLETSVSGKGSSYGSEHRERISSPCNSGFNGKFCLRYRLHFIIFASECSEYIRGTRKRQEHLRANRRRTGNTIREGSGLCYRQN